jgi:superoxide dismutase
MEIHHQKHHATYVDTVNKALETLHSFADLSVESLLARIKEVPEDKRQVVINQEAVMQITLYSGKLCLRRVVKNLRAIC